jgi:malonyl CoA-acyl carrier protein transacylase
MRTFLFPGQGSQIPGMGDDLFDIFPEYTKQADTILGYSLRELCLEDKKNQLQNTQYTQPALFVVNALTYLKRLEETKQKPDYVAGHSLGEYNALFAAQVFDFTTGLELVKKRGELMSLAKDGAMAAIIGLSHEEITNALKEDEFSAITIANYNSYQQFVISGSRADIEKAQRTWAPKKIHFITLPVGGAFHSPFMQEAQQVFSDFVKNFKFATPCLPVIANINAKPYHPAITQINLVNQITDPVRWIETIEFLQSKPDMEFQEIGPGKVLSGLVNRIKNKQ